MRGLYAMWDVGGARGGVGEASFRYRCKVVKTGTLNQAKGRVYVYSRIVFLHIHTCHSYLFVKTATLVLFTNPWKVPLFFTPGGTIRRVRTVDSHTQPGLSFVLPRCFAAMISMAFFFHRT